MEKITEDTLRVYLNISNSNKSIKEIAREKEDFIDVVYEAMADVDESYKMENLAEKFYTTNDYTDKRVFAEEMWSQAFSDSVEKMIPENAKKFWIDATIKGLDEFESDFIQCK